MATIPFSCHQHFTWCKIGDKPYIIKDYVSRVSAGQRTVVLVQDKATVRNVVAFLWGYNIPVLYHHSGHLGDQGRLAQVLDGYLTASKPIIISQERYCTTPFVCTADRLLVADFPTSINSYRDCKILIDIRTKKGLITTLVSETEDHLLPELRDYILQKGEPLPPWLAPKLVVPPWLEYPTVGVSSNEDNILQGNLKAPSSCPKKSHKPHWRKSPPKPPFIGPSILECPLEPDPKMSWTQVGISTTHTQSNSGTNRPSQARVSREVTYKYGPVDAQLKPDGHKYNALLLRHLQATWERSSLGLQFSWGTQHDSKSKSQSVGNSQSASILCHSIESHNMVPFKTNISPDPKHPMSPRSKALVPPVAPIVDNFHG